MKKTIWKFPLEIADMQLIKMPLGSKILTVQVQREKLCLWALVNPHPQLRKESRKILIYGTGYDIVKSKRIKYINTCQLHNGFFVGHVFEDVSGKERIENK